MSDRKLSDEKVAELFISMFPPAVKLAIGKPMRAVIVQAIQRERLRCVALLVDGVKYQQGRQAQAEAGLRLATDERAIEQLGLKRAEALGGIAALSIAGDILQLAPGSCAVCGGAGKIPSSILGGNGERMAVQCGPCSGTGQAPPEPAAPPSNGEIRT